MKNFIIAWASLVLLSFSSAALVGGWLALVYNFFWLVAR